MRDPRAYRPSWQGSARRVGAPAQHWEDPYWEEAPPRRRPPRAARPLPPRHRRLLRLVAIVAALLLVLALAGAVLTYQRVDRMLARGRQPVSGLTPVGGGPTNILLVGSDSRAGLSREELDQIATSEVTGQRTDTIILINVSPRRGKVTMLSIPRDLKVQVNGETAKINAAYARGGPDLLVRTVQENLQVPVHHFASLDFAGFLSVVDALGGVTLCNRTGRRLVDRDANLDMAPGCHRVDGARALAYVRARKIDSDFGRIGRQQEFIRAVMAEVVADGNLMNVPRLLDLGDAVAGHVRTDQGFGTLEAISLLRRLGDLSPEQVDMRLYPSEGRAPACSGCAAFVVPLPEAELLMAAIREDAAELPPVGLTGNGSVRLADVRLRVLNGSGVQGAATRTASALRAAGIRQVTAGNAPAPAARSTLAYPPGQEAHARLVAQLLAGPVELVAGGEGGALTLTLGSDWQGVKGAGAPAG